ncbi:MAG: hypothetical protein Ta2F_04960 [Termitinemataceae bacterium]|nr:MAG: hypothetical protein Ta2F_04960 [Termitinemataceae bacterium]
MRKLKQGIFVVIFTMCAGGILMLANCRSHLIKDTDSYYISGTKKEKEYLESLFTLLQQDKKNTEINSGTITKDSSKGSAERFAIVREIANVYKRQNNYGRLINFLSEWVDEHPEDSYNTYYLFMVAYSYIQQETYSVAKLYFNLIVKNYSDLIVKNESIHLLCLKQLIEVEDNPQQKIWYYEELISRFKDKIDLGVTWFLLGQTYEQVGDWQRAIQSYSEFLPFYGVVVPGFPDAYGYAKQMVDFENSLKNWTFESLGSLVGTIKSALDEGNTWQLWQYRARVNFFARSWAQAGSEDSGMAEFNLSAFGSSAKLRYSDNLSRDSNANEAYLRTWGWSQFTPIWYFYFRKIYFPLDPAIHGRWEWAGVYYGEKF